MKAESNIKQNNVWIKEVKDNTATIVLRSNFVESQLEEGETRFTYDEVEIQLGDRDNLDEYVNQHFEALFEMGMQREFEETLPTTKDHLFMTVMGIMAEIDFLSERIKLLEGK